MDVTVRDHLQRLQLRVENLSQKSMERNLAQEERNRLEAEIRAANLAITHYQAALELEQSLL